MAPLLFSIALVYTITYCTRYGYLDSSAHPGTSPLETGEPRRTDASRETATEASAQQSPAPPAPSEGASAETTLEFVLGFPSWVFWGIVVPWGVCTVIACWLSFAFIRDEPLEEAAPPPDAPSAGGEAER